MEAAAKSAGLPKATVRKLLSLAEAAQKCVAKLDAFSGRQLAAAMVKNDDGSISWAQGSAAGKALGAAQAAQVKLSSALAGALSRASDGNTQAALEELMLQCDRRVAEIETLALQMAEIVDKGGDRVLEQADALAGGRISSFTSGEALDKFGRGSALEAMKAELKPLADRLAKYAHDPAHSISEDDLASCTRELDALKAKFSEAAASGKIEVVGGKTVFCDRSMLEEAAKLLTDAEDKIASMHRDIVRGAMRNLVEKSFPFLNNEIFQERFENELSKVMSSGDKADGLAHFVKLMNVLRSTARAYVESPTPENKAKLENAAEVLMNLDREDAIDCLDQSFIKWAVPGKNASPEFKEALAKFKAETSGENGKRMLNDMAALVKRAYTGLDVAVAHLVELAGKLAAGPGNKVYVSSWVLGAFRGGCTVSSIVEARAHGYSDSDIDPRIDDSNVASYGILRTGLKTFKFPKGSSAHFVFHKTLNTLAASSGSKADFLKQVKKDPGIKTDVNGSIEIDLGKVVNRQLVQGLFHFCGLRSAAVPGEIDGELYDKLVALAPDAPDGGAARAEYLDSLAARLGAGSEQFKCAVKRLDDAIAHARKLKAEGKVYTAEQWETRDVQKDIATTALAKAKNHPDLPSASLPNAQAVKIRSDYIGSTNFFFRDFYDTVTRGGNRKSWFQ